MASHWAMEARLATARPVRAPAARIAPRLVVVATLLHVSAVAATLFVLWTVADAWPITAPLLFGPRWVLAAPLVVLFPAALAARSRVAIALQAAALALVAGPVMGLRLTVRGLGTRDAPRDLRIMTHNLGRVSPHAPAFLAALDAVRPDVVVLQECAIPGGGSVSVPGWHVREDDGMCLISRFPIVAVDGRDRQDVWNRGGSGAIVRYEIEGPSGRFDVLNVHLETPRDGLEALRGGDFGELAKNLEQRRWESEIARAWATRATAPLLVAGDFNMPVESALYRRYWSDFTNAFSVAGLGYGATKHTRLIGVRIDHVLLDSRWECVDAFVGPDTGSDHRPVVADLRLVR